MIFKDFLAGVLFGTLSTTAFAADLPSTKSAPVFVAPPPVFTWTGPYAGVSLGGVIGDSLFAEPVPLNGGGFLGGLTFGYNLQVAPNWLVGAEASFDYRGPIGGGSNSVATAYGTKAGFLGTFGPRLGYILFDRWMVFGTAGLAYGDTPTPGSYIGPVTPGAGTAGVFTGSQPFVPGWMYGGGVEYALTNNWFVRAEYIYAHLAHTLPVYTTNASAIPDPICEISRFNLITVGLSYKFDAPLIAVPVVGKY